MNQDTQVQHLVGTNQRTIALRPALPEDEAFLYRVYASTRLDEMNIVDWTAEQKEAFLQMQFRAQDRYYREIAPDAEYLVVLADGLPAGRLYILRQEDEIRIMDISLLPEYRKQGIGSALLGGILNEAQSNSSTVTIHVERFNPALHLYERLGFRLAEDQGVYYFMRWLPAARREHEGTASAREH